MNAVEEQQFLVTNPPHGVLDLAAVASLLGLDDEVTGKKMAFGAPEVLSASDPDSTGRLKRDLVAAGVSVDVVHGHDLSSIKWPTIVRRFTFDSDGLTVSLAGRTDERTIPWSTRVFAVSCRPPEGFPRGGPNGEVLNEGQLRLLLESGDGPLQAEAMQWGSVLDLYLDLDGFVDRVTFARDITDFSGLETPREGPEGGLVEALTQCALRFDRFSLDRRLEGVRPRQRFAMGQEGFDLDQRKLFSYGTLLLRQALNSVDPSLGDLTQYEFGSRIAWILRGRSGG